MQLLQHFKDLTLHPKNAKELKGLILQLAIQGNLTANWRKENPDIESATILLEKVKEEKLILIKEKKIKKDIDLPKIKKENEPFQIPNSWSWCYWFELLGSVEYPMKRGPFGSALKKADFVENGVRVFEQYNPINDDPDWVRYFITHEKYEKMKAFTAIEGDLLISCSGTLGRIGELPIGTEKGIINQALLKLTIHPKLISNKYFINLFRSHFMISRIYAEAMGSAIINMVGVKELKQFLIPLPTLAEQKEIVRVVETLFKQVEQLEQLTKERIALKEDFVTSALRQLTTANTETEWNYLQNHFKSFFTEKNAVKKLREAVLQLAVQGKLTVDWRKNNPDTEPAAELLKRIQKEKAQLIKDKKIKKESPLPLIANDEIPYELPESWVWCRLGETLLFSDAGKSPDCEKRPVVNQEWGVLTTTAIQKNKFNENANKVLPANYEINEKQIVEDGDILITRAGPINRTGIACKVKKINFNLILSDKTIRLKYIKELISPDFVVTTLNSSAIRDLLLKKMIGMASSQVNISQSNIKNIPFPFPPLEEQKAVVKKVNALMLLCDQLEQEVDGSKNLNEQLMKSVLREVFESKNEKEHA